MTDTPKVSFVIPVYNEEAILETSIASLVAATRERGAPFEIIIAENGSRDRTVEIAKELESRFPEVKYFSCDQPNYGRALKQGIHKARGELVICEEIDLCDTGFHRRAIEILDSGRADMVIGSKALGQSRDNRPLYRRAGTRTINGLLRISLGFKGTDTHGLKAFRRAALLPIIEKCIVEKDLFTSEMVIRAERDKVRIVEIPIELHEKRPPSIGLARRVPKVLKDLGRLVLIIRFNRKA
ncbi:MAG: Undecaprenyl-phosphate 4-deoxy-4-formamido-L-arabinose transferase [Myxococcota bacterium]|nr:Undecaprenyl-phosphate 4-deoxy-4-formamido-L-arabinose transferase [Myxococcota bacterium]